MSKIEPALTAKQWAHCRKMAAKYGEHMEESASDEIGMIYGKHGVAAWALDGEPFGFTREDVSALRDAIKSEYTLDGLTSCKPVDHEESRRLREALQGLIDRIEALLPPTLLTRTTHIP